MNDDNYPDDIRKYDSDPRSPFYVEPIIYCVICGDEIPEGEGDESDTWGGWTCNDCLDENNDAEYQQNKAEYKGE